MNKVLKALQELSQDRIENAQYLANSKETENEYIKSKAQKIALQLSGMNIQDAEAAIALAYSLILRSTYVTFDMPDIT